MSPDLLQWPLAALSLAATAMNVKKMRLSFVLWLATNAAWSVIQFSLGQPALGCLFLCYAGLSVYGIIEWRKPK